MAKLVFVLTSLALVIAAAGCRQEAATPQLPANPTDTLAGAGYVAGGFRGMAVYSQTSVWAPSPPNDTTYSTELFLTRKKDSTLILRCPAFPFDTIDAGCNAFVDAYFGADSAFRGNVLPDKGKGVFVQFYYYRANDSLYLNYVLLSSNGVGKEYEFFGRRL